MDDDIEVTREPGRHLAVVRFRAQPAEIGARTGPALGQVMAYLGRHGLQPSGPAVCHYDLVDDGFEVAAGFVVPVTIEAADGVEPLDLPEGEVLRTLHVGSYSELPQAYEALQGRAGALGRELGPGAWEEYLTGPEVPEELHRTVISWSLRS